MSRFSSDTTKCRSNSLIEPRVNLRKFSDAMFRLRQAEELQEPSSCKLSIVVDHGGFAVHPNSPVKNGAIS